MPQTRKINMSEAHALIIASLKDYLFNEGQICQNVDSRDHIFEIKDEENTILGFISLYDLKMLTQSSGDDFSTFQIRNIDQNEWLPVFSHPYFQRRKPQLVSAASLKDEEDQEIYILINGQKAGPYEKSQLLDMVKDKEILLTDMISTNGGHTWMKLYQLDQFNRRDLNVEDQLPGLPKKVIGQSHETVVNYKPVAEALTGLAYLSNVKKEKMLEEADKTSRRQGQITVEKTPSPFRLLMVMSIIFIVPFLVHIKNQLTSPFKDQEVQIGEKNSNQLKPVERLPANDQYSGQNNQTNHDRNIEQINDQGRNVDNFEQRQIEPIRPRTRAIQRPYSRKSFMESAKFQEIQRSGDGGSNGNGEDPNYYYDNSSAMELDPVRSQVSKENFEAAPPAENEGPIPTNDRIFESEVSN